MDVMIPKNNEEELISMAEQLGETEILLLYPLKEYKNKELKFNTHLKLKKGLLIDESDINKIPEANFIFIKNPGRAGFESKKITHVFEVENQQKDDFIHHRNSGLNQVLASELKNTNKTLCFSYNLLLNSRKPYKIIGRFAQNKKMCNKYKLKIEVFSFATKPYEIRALETRKALINML